MKTKSIELSAYKIYWAEFTPMTGKVVTKHDRKQLGEPLYDNVSPKYFRKHFANKEAALGFIKSFHKPLSKRYMVRLFTDKQFGMATQENGYAIPYTKKQLEEVYYVG